MDSSCHARIALFTLLVAGFGETHAAAQDLVLPPSHAATAGTGSTNVPLGRSTPTRAQFAYDASLFNGPRTITAVDLRVDDGLSAVGKRVELEVRMSSLGRSITQMQSAFASNRGVDESVVFARQLLDLPNAGSGAAPNGFDVPIPLDVSFPYDPAGGALVIELVVFGQAPGAYPLDTTFICASPRVDYGPAGCGPAGGPPLGADSVTTQLTWGGPMILRIHDAVPGTVTAFAFGFIESGGWAGLSLPVDLSVIGATGCWLSIDPTITVTAAADVTGTALYATTLPSRPELVGEWVRFQGLAIDLGANALGVVTSRAHKIQVCGWEPVARVYSAGTSSATGLREIGVAPIVRLR